MKSRMNIIVLVSAVVLALLMAVSAILLFQGIRKYSSAEKRASKLFRKLAAFYEDDPFPSPANVETKELNAAKLNQWAEDLVAEMKKGESQLVEKSPLLFMRRLGDTRNKLLAAADNKNVTVKPQFAFGFEQYLGEGGGLPPPPLVPRLTHQLVAIESVTRLLIEHNVTAIDAISRQNLEASASVPRTGRGVRGSRGHRLPEQQRPETATPENDTSGGGPELFSIEHLGVEFHAREAVIVNVINALGAMPLPLAVSRIELRRDGVDVLIPPPPSAVSGEAGQGAAAIVPQPDLVHEKRIVSGHKIETPLRVLLELKIYRFSREERGEDN